MKVSWLICFFFYIGINAQTVHTEHDQNKKVDACCSAVSNSTSNNGKLKLGDMEIPNVSLLNQDGESVDFSKLVRNKVVAINFIFTSCTTICPPMGANFGALKRKLESHVDKDLVMISVSLDAARDTPERLKDWSDKFKAGPGWHLLTGEKQEVDRLLKALNVFTPLIEEHAPIILFGKEGENNWIRTDGLSPADELAEIAKAYLEGRGGEIVKDVPEGKTSEIAATNLGVSEEQKTISKEDKEAMDRAYFSDAVLIDQNGNELKFYTDLLHNKVVVINCFFTECTGVCPVMNRNLKAVQEYYNNKIGSEINIVSLSVDALHDTTEILHAYSEAYGAIKGWYFLSGDNSNVERVLSKLGLNVETRESHESIMILGNLKTGLWKKVNGLSSPQELIQLVDSVVYDEEKTD